MNTIDYVEWVNKVMKGFVKAWQKSDANQQLIGIEIHDIVPALGFNIDTRTPDFNRTKLGKSVRDALRDLDRLGLVNQDYRHFKLTQEGSKFPIADLTTSWPQIMDVYLNDEQQTVLKKISEIGQEVFENYVCLRELSAQQVFEELNWLWDREGIARGYLITDQLHQIGMIQRSATMGGHISINPTYIGITRVTRVIETEWSKLVKQLIEEWETTNVDFKQELNINKDKEKAEFVKDILGLATTNSSGRRFLVIGFEDKTHLFVKSIDSTISQERLEQILFAYTEPTPQIKLNKIPWEEGQIGIIEVFRDSKAIPYKVKKELGGKHGIKIDSIYVRHGSHTEAPTPRELDDLKISGI